MESDPDHSARIRVLVGDITREAVDAIVNAANASLMGGGGVDGAIHRAGGPEILQACIAVRRGHPEGLPTGQAVATPAGRLPARFVIHTVGPVYGRHGGREAKLLAACYENSVALAAELRLATMAFPAISTGAYGYPKHEAASVALAALGRALARHKAIVQVRLVYYSEEDAGFARSRLR